MCIQKEKSHEEQSMFFEITFSTTLEMLTNLSLFFFFFFFSFLQKLQKAADVDTRQYKGINIYNYAPEKSS